MTRTLASIALIGFALLAAACGTVATPVWEKPAPTATRVEPSATPIPPTQPPAAVAPTSTPIPPTASEVPPTIAATSIPSTTAAVPATSATSAPSNDPIVFFVSQSDPEHGKQLFNTFFDQAGYMCATCHRVDSEEKLIGPGQLNVGVRAATRVPGQVAERYIYNSITNPQAFVVPGYPQNLMPQVYSKIFSEQDIYDLIAYLMTLRG